ncbi:IS1-like element transposase [Xenorhabdus cabanillasii]
MNGLGYRATVRVMGTGLNTVLRHLSLWFPSFLQHSF